MADVNFNHFKKTGWFKTYAGVRKSQTNCYEQVRSLRRQLIGQEQENLAWLLHRNRQQHWAGKYTVRGPAIEKLTPRQPIMQQRVGPVMGKGAREPENKLPPIGDARLTTTRPIKYEHHSLEFENTFSYDSYLKRNQKKKLFTLPRIVPGREAAFSEEISRTHQSNQRLPSLAKGKGKKKCYRRKCEDSIKNRDFNITGRSIPV